MVKEAVFATSSKAHQPPELEQRFRQYSQVLAESDDQKQFIGCDGKVLRGSFDNFKDKKAILKVVKLKSLSPPP